MGVWVFIFCPPPPPLTSPTLPEPIPVLQAAGPPTGCQLQSGGSLCLRPQALLCEQANVLSRFLPLPAPTYILLPSLPDLSPTLLSPFLPRPSTLPIPLPATFFQSPPQAAALLLLFLSPWVHLPSPLSLLQPASPSVPRFLTLGFLPFFFLLPVCWPKSRSVRVRLFCRTTSLLTWRNTGSQTV